MNANQAQLDRLSILLVEPSRFLGSLIRSVLRAFQINTVIEAHDGREAVQIMETAITNPLKVEIGGIDVIISELMLPDMTGRALLRWVRTSDTSPDRFIPFVVLTAAADEHNVNQARDLGTTEFMVKPFSTQSIADHLMRVINHPRQFVLCEGYFGPDRRRRAIVSARERRTIGDDEIEVVHSSSTAAQSHFDRRVTLFRLINRLKDKVGAFEMISKPIIDPSVIEDTQKHIQAIAGDYADWVADSIQTLQNSVAALAAGTGNKPALLQEINRIAHEFRGQGGIFDYPLTSEFGKSLYEATQDRGIAITANVVKLMEAHVDSLKVIMQQKIRGDGGPVGRELLKSLAQAKHKYRSHRPAKG